MESQQGSLWAVLISTYAAATVCIVCRFLGRYLARTPLWYDDYAAIACYFMATGYNILCYSWIHRGMGLHVQDITYAPVAKVIYNLKLHLFAAELIYAACLAFGQVSILCLYWRIFSVPEARLTVKVLLPFTLVWVIVRFFMTIFNCRPVQYHWDASVPGECGLTTSWFWFYFSTGLIYVLVDICIMAIPIKQIVKLHIPTGQKIGAAVMFLFGLLIGAGAVIIMIKSTKIDMTDISWSVAPILAWAIGEVNLVTVSISIPTIKPVFFWCASCLAPERYKLPSSPRSTRTPRSQFTKARKSFPRCAAPYGDTKGMVPSWQPVDPVDSASFNDMEFYPGGGGDVRTVVTRYTEGNSPNPRRHSMLRAGGRWPDLEGAGSQVWRDMARPQKSLSPEPRLVRRITIDFVIWEGRPSEDNERRYNE